MWRRWQGLILGTALLTCAAHTDAAAQAFTSGSTGADGALAPTSSTTLTLPPSGVFNFTTITIPTGVTVTLGRNATNTPATLLATGDVTIAGTLDLAGQRGSDGTVGTPTATNGGLPGAGGGAGGSGSTGTLSATGGPGVGPGGGAPGSPQSGGLTPHCSGAGGGHNGAGGSGSGGFTGTCAAIGGPSYGGARLLPLLGGSGGGGGSVYFGASAGGGGGGGGAVFLASSTKLTLSGTIRANGGNGGNGYYVNVGSGAGGGGSGGAVRLVAPILTGTGGAIQVAGGAAGAAGSVPGSGGGYVSAGVAGPGASGRIRLEATTFSLTATMTVGPSQGPLGTVSLANGPSLQFTSVAGVSAPASPQGAYGTPDLTLPAGFTNPVAIAVQATQIPVGTVVTVRSLPLQGAASSATGSLSGAVEASTASLSLTLPTTQPTVLTAEATFALTASAGNGPLYVEGEEVTHIRVAAAFGGDSTMTYITRSGREVLVR